MRVIRAAVAIAGIMFALPALAQAPATFLDYKTTVPAGWVTRAPSSPMRLAEYTIPSVNGEVVVYFFGEGQGGTVAANLARWKGQFSTPDGSPVPEAVTHDSAAAAFPIDTALDGWKFVPTMVMVDPPLHTAFRRLVGRGFTPRQVATLEPAVRTFVVERIEQLRSDGSGDFVTAFAGPLPSFVVATYLGVSEADRGQFASWTESIPR